MAEAGGEDLAIAKDVYAGAQARFDELTRPYATVIDIRPASLPTPDEVKGWDAETFASTLRHDRSHPRYDP